jgi:mRNA-degrading endonuclease RelE of RelBE toxin-antitoxin system
MDRLPPRVIPAVIGFLFGPLADEPHTVGKPLSGDFAGLFGARRGDYRVLYEIRDEPRVIVVHRVAHRVDAYRPPAP